MIQIVFKNLEVSELARNAVLQRLEHVVEKFPSLSDHKMTTTLSMENSPSQPGPDVFGIRLRITGKYFRDVEIEKKSSSLYLALSSLCESLLERLNRQNDKKRVKSLKSSRKLTFIDSETTENIA